jgi:hypothetical protein
VRASTSAIGTPSTRQATVLAAEVSRLRRSAARDASEVTSVKNRDHGTRTVMATRGSRMNNAARPAGSQAQRGTPA